jgi:hypothetical protein
VVSHSQRDFDISTNLLADQCLPSSLFPGNLENHCREEERAATAQYLRMLADLVMYRVRDVYKAETLEERPPWMAPRPLARLRYQLPTTAEKLAQVVKKQVSEKLILSLYFLRQMDLLFIHIFKILILWPPFFLGIFLSFYKKARTRCSYEF